MAITILYVFFLIGGVQTMNSSIFDGDDEEGIYVLSSLKNKTCKLGMKAEDNFKSSYCVVIEGIGCMCEWKVN